MQSENPTMGADLDPGTLEKLTTHGQMVLVEEDSRGVPRRVTAGILIDAPTGEVWSTLTDYERFSEFMPQTRRTRVRKTSGDSTEVEHHLKLSLSAVPGLGLGIRYVLRYTHRKPDRIDFQRVEGDLREVSGGWELIPSGTGEKTLAFYRVYTDLKSIGRVVDFALKQEPAIELAINVSSAVLVVKAVKERTESRRRS